MESNAIMHKSHTQNWLVMKHSSFVSCVYVSNRHMQLVLQAKKLSVFRIRNVCVWLDCECVCARLLESVGKHVRQLVDGRIGDRLSDGLVHLLAHVRRQLSVSLLQLLGADATAGHHAGHGGSRCAAAPSRVVVIR